MAELRFFGLLFMFSSFFCVAMVPSSYFATVAPIEGYDHTLRFFTSEQLKGIIDKINDPALPAIGPRDTNSLINRFGFVALPVSSQVLDLLYELSKLPSRNDKNQISGLSLTKFFRKHSLDLQPLGYAVYALACLRDKNILERIMVQIYPDAGGASWTPGHIHQSDGRMCFSGSRPLPMLGYVSMKLVNGKLRVQQLNYGVNNQTITCSYNC